MGELLKLLFILFLGAAGLILVISIGLFLLPFLLLGVILYLLFNGSAVRVRHVRVSPPPPRPDAEHAATTPPPAGEDVIDVTAIEVPQDPARIASQADDR